MVESLPLAENRAANSNSQGNVSSSVGIKDVEQFLEDAEHRLKEAINRNSDSSLENVA